MQIFRVTALVFSLWASEIAASYAAVYVLIPGIPGETTEVNHVGWVELQTLNWGHGEAPPGSPVRVQFNKVTVTKQLDSVSPALAALAANGQQLRDVKAEIVRPTGAGTTIVTFRLKLTNVRLTTYAGSVSSNQIGVDTFGFEFDTISWISFNTNKTGTAVPGTSGCWDIPANKACLPSF